MKIRKVLSATAVASLLSLSIAGAALADDSISVTNTGPSSTNVATVTNNNSATVTNTNNLTVTNTNNQTATSGPANVSGNTNAGSATTGSASNNNTTSTSINVNNNTSGVLAALGGGSLGGGTLGNSGGSANVGGGSLGMPANVGGGELPNTGATSPIDVSALRNLLNPANSDNLVKQSSGLSAMLLTIAALLSLAGAIGSAIYANKRAA